LAGQLAASKGVLPVEKIVEARKAAFLAYLGTALSEVRIE
jgi:hypothetical protein